MNATQLLTKQHELEQAKDPTTKRALFSKLADSVAAHIGSRPARIAA
jgi:hypothetical protein